MGVCNRLNRMGIERIKKRQINRILIEKEKVKKVCFLKESYRIVFLY